MIVREAARSFTTSCVFERCEWKWTSSCARRSLPTGSGPGLFPHIQVEGGTQLRSLGAQRLAQFSVSLNIPQLVAPTTAVEDLAFIPPFRADPLIDSDAGCVGLSRKDFHILNKPYDRSAYFAITARLTHIVSMIMAPPHIKAPPSCWSTSGGGPNGRRTWR